MYLAQVKSIGLYVAQIIYRCGGTESYTVKIAQSLQSIYPDADITFICELFNPSDRISDSSFVDKIKILDGTHIRQGRTHIRFVPASEKTAFSRRRMYHDLENSSKDFDLFFYCSRGNLIFKARKNVAIIHFPVLKIEEQKKKEKKFCFTPYIRRKDRMYEQKYDLFLPNSSYTESWLKRRWPEISESKIKLIYPPIIPIEHTGDKKEKSILVCSRIERSKKIEVLIEAFKSSAFLSAEYALWIVGGIDKKDMEYVQYLRNLAEGCNISFYTDVPHEELARLYNKASFFWHCKGYGVDEEKDPYKLEHFGITTVEAMSAGCIPVVINMGGQKEIVTNGTGYTWNTPEELVEYTEETAKDSTRMFSLSVGAVERSRYFSMESFTDRLEKLLSEI